MAEIVRMPKLSDTMTEGVVAEWHKKVGDNIESGELLAEIETDKATMEFESFQEGVLLHIGVEKGQTAPVDSILAILGEKGEDIENLLNEDFTSGVVEEPKKEIKEEVKVIKPEPVITAPVEVQPVIEKPVLTNTSSSTNNTISNLETKASPLAKKLAKERGVNLKLKIKEPLKFNLKKESIESITTKIKELIEQ